MVLNSIYEKCWDLYCVKVPSKNKKIWRKGVQVLCGKWLKASQTHTDGSKAFCVAALSINLSRDVTSSNHLLFGGICPKTTSLSGATDSQYHTHKHTVPLCPPGTGFYPECHFLCLDMISVGNRKPSTFFSHDSRVAWGEAWLLNS